MPLILRIGQPSDRADRPGDDRAEDRDPDEDDERAEPDRGSPLSLSPNRPETTKNDAEAA